MGERETDRERERERERQTDRQTDRQTETDRQTDSGREGVACRLKINDGKTKLMRMQLTSSLPDTAGWSIEKANKGWNSRRCEDKHG